MKLKALLLALGFAFVCTNVHADSISVYDVDIQYSGSTLNGVMDLDETTGTILGFAGLLDWGGSGSLGSGGIVDVTGSGGSCGSGASCLDWGGTSKGLSFVADLFLSCSPSLVGFSGGALPSGCDGMNQDHFHIFGFNSAAGHSSEVGGAGFISGSAIDPAPTAATPEPATSLLLFSGMLGLGWAGARKRTMKTACLFRGN